MFEMLGFFVLLLVVFAITAQLWLQFTWRRIAFGRHHDHLVPPTPRSPRFAP